MNSASSARMSQSMEGRPGGGRPVSQPLSVSIPNSMSYRDARPPPVSPNDDHDDDNLSPTKSYYNPLTSPGSPEMPKAFFNYNYDRIQNDLLDEICDEIGIKDATDLDFMDFEPPGAEANFDPGPIGGDMDNLDQLIMFGQIEGQGPGPSVSGRPSLEKWKQPEGQQEAGEGSSSTLPAMPNNSPVYGRSPAKNDSIASEYGPTSVEPGCTSPYQVQHNSPVARPPSTSNQALASGSDDLLSAYSESQAIQSHMTDDHKIASPRKSAAEAAASCSSQHDSMRKMAIAQDRMRSTSVSSPASVDASSPYNQQVLSPSNSGKPSSGVGGGEVNQTDASKGQAGAFATPETLPPGKERAMSRMKLSDNASGKRSPFDQGYFSVGSGGSHTEEADLAGVTPPQCPESAHTAEDNVLDLLTGSIELNKHKPLTDDALLSMAQGSKQASDVAGSSNAGDSRGLPHHHQGQQSLPGQQPPPRLSTVKIEAQEQEFQPPRSPGMAKREYHKAHVPRSTSSAATPGMFQRPSAGINPFTQPYPNTCTSQQPGAGGEAPAAQPTMSASENCAPYPRSFRHDSDMSYGSKRSASNPSSPKKQRRLTYNPYPENNNVSYSGSNNNNNPEQGRYNMSGQSVNNSQYVGEGSMMGPSMGAGAPGQINNMPSRTGYGSNVQAPQQQRQQPQQQQQQPTMGSQMHPNPPYPSNQSHYSSQSQYGNEQNQGQQQQMMPGQSYQQNPNQSMYRPPSASDQQLHQQPQQQLLAAQNQNQYPQNPPLSPTSQESAQYQQSSLGALIAGHPDASKYGFMQQLISDRSNAFRSHPLFPLLRDLIVADMNFSSPSFPFQLIANLPSDFDKLLSNYFQRNPVQTKYEVNHSVENVVLDALRYAHKALIEKITERKRKAGISEMPKSFNAIEDFCDRFDQAVKNTLSQENTPKSSMPQHTPQQQGSMLSHAQHQMHQPQQPPQQHQQYAQPQSSYQHSHPPYPHHQQQQPQQPQQPRHHLHPQQNPHMQRQPQQQQPRQQQQHHLHQSRIQHPMNSGGVQPHHMAPQQSPAMAPQPSPAMAPRHHHSQGSIPSHHAHPGMAPSPSSMSQPSPGLPTMEPHTGGSSMVPLGSNSMQPGHQGMGGMPAPPAHQNPYHKQNSHRSNSLPPPSNGCGPHGNMSSMPHPSQHQYQQQQQMGRSISPLPNQYSAADQNTALQRQSSYPGQWPGGRNFNQGGHASSLPSTPTKSGFQRNRFHQGNSSSTINLNDVPDLTAGHLANQQKMGFSTGSMPNFVSSSGIAERITNNTPPLMQHSPHKMGMHSPRADIQRAGSEPSLNNMRNYPSPQRQQSYGGTENKNNNNNTSSNGGSRKQVLPKEAVAIMMEWLREHRDNPYPNDDEKYMLIQQTKLTMAQINYWFTNARRRILPKWTLQRLMEEQARATGRELTPEEQKEIMSTKLTPQAVRNILEGNSMKKQISDVSYGHIMNSVLNQS